MGTSSMRSSEAVGSRGGPHTDSGPRTPIWPSSSAVFHAAPAQASLNLLRAPMWPVPAYPAFCELPVHSQKAWTMSSGLWLSLSAYIAGRAPSGPEVGVTWARLGTGSQLCGCDLYVKCGAPSLEGMMAFHLPGTVTNLSCCDRLATPPPTLPVTVPPCFCHSVPS